MAKRRRSRPHCWFAMSALLSRQIRRRHQGDRSSEEGVMDFFLQLTINGLVVGSIYGLVAMGFVIIFKSSSILNFAQGEFLLFGAYISLTIVTVYKVPFFAAILLTLVFAVVLGL